MDSPVVLSECAGQAWRRWRPGRAATSGL